MNRQPKFAPSAIDLYFEANPSMRPASGRHTHAGWDSAVIRALKKLQALVEATGARIQPVQIKEKFGSLRIYLRAGKTDHSQEHREHQARVDAVQMPALEIGRRGRPRHVARLRTLRCASSRDEQPRRPYLPKLLDMHRARWHRAHVA